MAGLLPKAIWIHKASAAPDGRRHIEAQPDREHPLTRSQVAINLIVDVNANPLNEASLFGLF